ncbi:hypothetical protein A3F37_01440 [Candidatus Saccharibacteria bacterium RIFCSPHIGHO2_12_FULL_41_12]|nr:MAG: hypothetical protein A3F37_01440 [Candidatus Saccharibacteria bacterium RIFCSPHIGHO2_12_FULL_41_12]
MSIAVAVLAVIVIAGEVFWHKKILSSELSRKFIHIIGGLWIASWPFLINFEEIRLLSLITLVAACVSHYHKIFLSIHSVKRKTYGASLFPLGILLTSFITDDPWIFFVAVAHLALADGLAAVVGKKWGKKVAYHIGHEAKTVLGSVTFLLSSLAITTFYTILSGRYEDYMALLITMPLILSVIENITIKGLDNLLVPIAVVLLVTYT